MAPLRRELKPLLERYESKSPKYKRTRGLARNLLKVWPALWTFTEIDGVEPTNNRAERGLRGAVIYRKLSLGSQSDQGERTIERLLSASQTCRLQRALALRLPGRRPQRQDARRPPSLAHLIVSARGLNAYHLPRGDRHFALWAPSSASLPWKASRASIQHSPGGLRRPDGQGTRLG